MSTNILWLPLSVLLGIITATGGSFLFACLYLFTASNFGLSSDGAVLIVRNYTFVFVFACLFSAVFVAKKVERQAGKFFELGQILTLVIFFAGYMTGLWPQPISLEPDFTVRAFLWFGGSAALSLCVSHYTVIFHHGFLDDRLPGFLYLLRNLIFTGATIVAASPLVVAVFSGGLFQVPRFLLLAPIVLGLIGALIVGVRYRELSILERFKAIVLVWYPFGWCLLLMPILLLAETLIGGITTPVFDVGSQHLYTAIAAFGVLNLALVLGLIVAAVALKILDLVSQKKA